MKTLSSIAETQPSIAYILGPVERFGRRIKVEYLGMASVYSIIALLFFGDFPSWFETFLATLGAFFLFLELKKKTGDHLVGSLVLFAAVRVAQGPAGGSVRYGCGGTALCDRIQGQWGFSWHATLFQAF
jgi:hypothetical protein